MAAELPGESQLHTTQYTRAALRCNNYPHHETIQTLNSENWARPAFPAAELVARITHRPMATCTTLARLAGFREVEAQ